MNERGYLNVFIQADNEWGKALSRNFGNSACNARYEKRGKGLPGTELRRLYEARDKARIEWQDYIIPRLHKTA